MKAKLAARFAFQPVNAPISADAKFSKLVDIDLEDRLAAQTRQRYADHMRQLVLPAFGELTRREIGLARCDQFIKALAKVSHNKVRQAKSVMRLAFGLVDLTTMPQQSGTAQRLSGPRI
ncbi:MAG: hypothetical protein LBD77_03560, partial [Bifidobacteriaceae bacterium]|nr:hypothetical protein [Bifidobacteriaceae bacterium]